MQGSIDDINENIQNGAGSVVGPMCSSEVEALCSSDQTTTDDTAREASDEGGSGASETTKSDYDSQFLCLQEHYDELSAKCQRVGTRCFT